MPYQLMPKCEADNCTLGPRTLPQSRFTRGIDSILPVGTNDADLQERGKEARTGTASLTAFGRFHKLWQKCEKQGSSRAKDGCAKR